MRRLLALVAVGALVLVACGDDDGATAPTTTGTSAPADPVGAENPMSTVAPTDATTTSTTTVAPIEGVVPADGCTPAETGRRTLVDDRRVTPATAETDERPERTIEIWIDRPVEPGSWPLVVLAHGLTGHPRSHEQHRRHLAGACFVVAAPAFPLTNADVEGSFLNAGDVQGQIDDVSFLIDAVLDDPEVGPSVDAERIGMVGHSLGGLTTAGAAVAPDADTRIDAAIVMSAGFVEARDDVAVMVLHGDDDRIVPIGAGAAGWAAVSGRGVFATLLGGDHLSGIIDGVGVHGPVVRELTTAFLAHELENGSISGFDALDPALVAVVARTTDGPLEDWTDYFSS